MLIDNLTNYKRSSVIAEGSVDYSKNITATEALHVVKADFDDRISVIEDSLSYLTNDNVATVLATKVLPNNELPLLKTDSQCTIEEALVGKVKIAEINGSNPSIFPDDALAIVNGFEHLIGSNGIITTPVIHDDEVKASCCALEAGHSFYSPVAYATFYHGEYEFNMRVFVLAGKADELSMTHAGAILCSINCPAANPFMELQGWYMQRYIPTNYALANPSSATPDNEFFTMTEQIRGLMDNTSTYEILSDAINKTIAGESNMADFVTELSVKFKNFSQNSAPLLDSIKSRGLTVAGVSSVLRDFMGAIDSAEAEDDYHFSFTDNEGLVPKTVLWGAFASIGKVIGYAITAIGGFTKPIITVIGLIITGIFKLIELGIDKLKKKTLSQFDESATLSCFSPGLLQRTMYLSSFDSDVQEKILVNGCTQIKYVGCTIIFFIMEIKFDATGHVDPYTTQVGIEAHVNFDIIPTSDVKSWLYGRILRDGSNVCEGWLVPNYIDVRNKWEEFMESQGAFSDYIPGMTDEELDLFIRECYFVNFMFTFFHFFSGTSAISYRNSSLAVADNNGAFTHTLVNSSYCMAYWQENGTFIPTWKNITAPGASGFLQAMFAQTFIKSNLASSFETSGIRVTRGPGQSDLTLGQLIDLNIIEASQWWDDYCALPIAGKISYQIVPATLASETFWRDIIILAIAAVAIVATAVVGTIKMKKSIQKWNATHQAKVESAWTAYTENPSAENYSNYRSAVFKNNWLTKLTGGTKYSYTNYWGDSDTASASSAILDRFQESFSSDPSEQDSALTINQVVKLIAG